MAAPLKKTQAIYQLPHSPTWISDLVARSNGTLLAARLDAARILAIDPATATLPNPPPVYSVMSFPPDGPGSQYNAVGGVAELQPDVFVFSLGVYNRPNGELPGTPQPGSWGLATLTFGPTGIAETTALVDIPEAVCLGRVVADGPGSVLVADSGRGVVYAVDTVAKTYSVRLQDESMLPAEGQGVGIGGLRRNGSGVVYTNASKQTMSYLNLNGGLPAEVIAQGVPMDGFVFDLFAPHGLRYIAGGAGNVVYSMTSTTTPAVIAGEVDTLELAGATAVALGRVLADKRTLYVATNGALSAPVKGQLTEAAKIVAVDLDS